ncbi:UspA [Dillenia turbinata]|uniref:UspA n=1 Tax=Dillenia turbinata TaxID=194707 RepID=A0AAN8ZBA4_9MAGN
MEAEEKKVMVAIDESECSHYALEWALQNLHDSIAKSKLYIFTVQPLADLNYLYASTLGSAHPELVRSVQETQKRVASALLEKAKTLCANQGIVAETVSEAGNPKDAICEAVNKFKIKLLILGSHGRGALKRAFQGSVSNYCVQNAKCPVLVVRRHE